MRLRCIFSIHLYFTITFQLARPGARCGSAEKRKGTGMGPGERNTVTGVSQSSFQAPRVEVGGEGPLWCSLHHSARSGVQGDEAIKGQRPSQEHRAFIRSVPIRNVRLENEQLRRVRLRTEERGS